WFNEGEMAGTHTVNGVKVLCVVDAATVNESNFVHSDPAQQRRGEGLMTSALTVYLRRDEYKGVPFVGQPLTVDGRKYRIDSYGDYEGMLELNVSEVRARCYPSA
ncbi:MAG: hypothetical protein IJ233_12710, partial [Pyramidobacter sp.]|nr:hypothetical protein [Pyramidobacter sp.]